MLHRSMSGYYSKNSYSFRAEFKRKISLIFFVTTNISILLLTFFKNNFIRCQGKPRSKIIIATSQYDICLLYVIPDVFQMSSFQKPRTDHQNIYKFTDFKSWQTCLNLNSNLPKVTYLKVKRNSLCKKLLPVNLPKSFLRYKTTLAQWVCHFPFTPVPGTHLSVGNILCKTFTSVCKLLD